MDGGGDQVHIDLISPRSPGKGQERSKNLETLPRGRGFYESKRKGQRVCFKVMRTGERSGQVGLCTLEGIANWGREKNLTGDQPI